MKLTIDRDALAEAVTWAARALPNKPPVPVLAGLLLEATPDGVLRLSSFDYEVSARIEVSAEVLDGGTVLVAGKLLADICRSLPAKPVTLALDGTRVRVTCGSSKFTLLTMPADEYPSLPATPGQTGTIDPATFAAAVAQVAPSASRDDGLPILTGVRMEIDGKNLTLTSTDRYRLAVRTLPWSPVGDVPAVAALIRARNLTEVAKTFAGAGDITIVLSADLAAFEAGTRRATTLLIDGDYPKVGALFPAEYAAHAVIDVAGFTDAVKRVALCAGQHMPIRCLFTGGEVTLESGQGEDAQASEAVEATLIGEDMAHSYNPRFLIEGLAALTTPFARLSFTAAGKPVVITGQAEAEGDDDSTFKYLLMPVREPATS